MIKYGSRGGFSPTAGYIIIYLKIINQGYPQETKAFFRKEPAEECQEPFVKTQAV